LIAIILAGGYGKRLQPLSGDVPKPLLEIAGKPIVGHIFDKLAEVEDVRRVIISTNLRFEQHFRKWLDSSLGKKTEIIADRSRSEEEKPGAITSLAQLTSKISDSCLIIGGDNLFTTSLRPMVRAFKERPCTTVALYDVKDRELARQYSTVTIDDKGRITGFSEKPAEPDTTLVGTCIYILPKSALSRLREYLVDAANRDSPGRFIEWLCKREPVYGYILDGYWWDIGVMEQYVALSLLKFSQRRPQTLSVTLGSSGELKAPSFDQIFKSVAKDDVTVVIPTLNEAEAISKVIEEVRTEGYRNILVVDGDSTDGTADAAVAMGVDVLLQHGAGKAGAVKTAMERVNTPYTVFIDGDCTYDPKDIGKLLNHIGRYAHVIGARDWTGMNHLHRLGNWIISQLFGVLFEVKVTDVCSGMYLLETTKARKYSLEEPGFIVETELAAQSASAGALTEVKIDYRPRIGARKLRTWRHGLDIFFAAFRLARRYNPILLYSSLAALSVIPAVSILLWVALRQLIMGIWHSGWALVGAMFLFVAALSFVLASISIMIRQVEKRLMKEIENLTKG